MTAMFTPFKPFNLPFSERLPERMAGPVLRGVALCALLGSASLLVHAAAPASAEPPPLLIRQGEHLSVPASSPLRARLVVSAVAQLAAPHRISLPAVVEADPAATVNILPAAAGRLVALKVGLGDSVKRGQVLALISSGDLAQAVSDEQKARDALDLAQRALTRAQGVSATGANAAKDVEAAQSAVTQAQSEWQRSQARLKALGAPMDPKSSPTASPALQITSPISGVVTALNVGAGSFVNDPAAALMTVSDLARVWVDINVPENLLGVVANGQSVAVTLAAYPGRSFEGKVVNVAAMLDPDTRRAKARVAFANPGGLLKPNMFASASLALPEAAQPVVPASALLMNNDSVSVFVEVSPWVFVRRYVELGREDGEQVRIRSGLKAGERIVVRGGVLLND